MPSKAVTINPDLKKERERATFDPEELTILLDGGVENTKERRQLVEFFAKDPIFKDEVPLEYLSYPDRYREAVRKSCLLICKLKEWLDLNGLANLVEVYKKVSGGLIGSTLIKEGSPFAPHLGMFLPTIMGQGTVEQQAAWLGRAWTFQILGAYAQTEMGHGTNIRRLETTATYDPQTEEFVLNSPTLTSYKWWPGSMGHTSNHAIVMAQLYTNGKCHGIQSFIVPLRDLETHQPLPGIKIGEIGCKLGMNGGNQGYLGFENFRIPRENMLMKNAKVLKDGTFVKSPMDKLTYGTLIFMRVIITEDVSASYLSQAVTIATRYSCVRRQSELRPGEEEPLIIDYRTQQYKLFPHIAATLAMKFSSRWIWEMYISVTSELEQGDLERIPEIHALSCGLKAVSTGDAARGIEECRRACGGHGYMSCSGFPGFYAMTTAAETYDGENTVLLLQTGRYLMKVWHMAKAGQSLPLTVKYLEKHSERKLPWTNDLPSLVAAYEQTAVGLVMEVTEKVDKMVSSGHIIEVARNQYSNSLVKAAEAHTRLFMVKRFVEVLSRNDISHALKNVLGALCELHGVYWLLKNLGDFLVYSNVQITDVEGIKEWQEKLLEEIRPNAVSIVDGFDIADEILDSPLGAWDGNVYERLFNEAQKSPLNAKPVDESFEKYLKPFFKSNM